MAAEKEVPQSDGSVVRVRLRDPLDMVFDGDVPDVLSPVVERLIAQSMQANGVPSAEQVKLLEQDEDEQQSADFLSWVVCTHATQPRLTASLDEYKALRTAGTPVKHLSQLKPPDIRAIFYTVLGVANIAALFRRTADAIEALELVRLGEATAAESAAADS